MGEKEYIIAMAELRLYKCKKCGWEIEAPNEGTDFLMDGLLAYYVCHDCKHVFGKTYALGTVFEGKETCPKCQGKMIFTGEKSFWT